VGVRRQRLDLGPADLVVGAVMSDELIVDFFVGVAKLLVDLDTAEIAGVEVVGPHRPEVHIPHYLGRGSLSSMRGNGCPATYPTIVSLFGARRTCAEYFSVASLYGGGQSIRPVGMIFIDIPLTTRQYS